VCVLPFVVMAPSGSWYVIAYNLRRPPQLESLVSNAFLLMAKYGSAPVHLVESYHSIGVRGSYTAGAAVASSIILGVLVLACALWTWRLLATSPRSADTDVLVSAVAATIVILIVFGKVLSPQYMMWLLPVTLVVRGRAGWAAVALTVCALVTTLAYFPLDYGSLGRLGYASVRLLTLRNLALVALLIVCWPRPQLAGWGRATPTTVDPAAHQPIV
jgi:hypothetical protein